MIVKIIGIIVCVRASSPKVREREREKERGRAREGEREWEGATYYCSLVPFLEQTY